MPPQSRALRNSSKALPLLSRPRAIVRFLVDRTAPLAPKLMLIFAVLYAVSPVDLIPDVAPIITWLDDAGLVALSIGWALSAVRKHAALTESKPDSTGEPQAIVIGA